MLSSRLENTLADRVTQHVLDHHVKGYTRYSYLWPNRGSDERNYCSPGVDLPVVSVMRSKYGEYPEYHTSLDDLDLVSEEGLGGAWEVLRKCLVVLENDERYRVTTPGEPQLGRRGLYPATGSKESGYERELCTLMNVLAYADGDHTLLDIAQRIGVSMLECLPVVQRLVDAGLLAREERR